MIHNNSFFDAADTRKASTSDPRTRDEDWQEHY